MAGIVNNDETVIEDDEVQPSQMVADTKNMLDSVKLSDKEIELSKNNSEAEALYSEFSEFLKVKTGMEEDEGVKNVIPTGIDVLDAILGGGFAVGAFSVITGLSGSGKSMLAMQVMAAAQRKFKTLIATFLDSEEATTSKRLANLGVRNPPIKPYTDITIEKVFKHLEAMCLFKEQKKILDLPSVVVWDSIANTLSEKERAAEDINSVIGYKARMLSILVPKYVARVAQYNICWIAVNQLRDVINMSMFSQPKELKFMSTGKSMPGGNVLKYNSFTLLEMKPKSILKPEMYGFEGGISIMANSVKNKLFAPNIPVELFGTFTKGFSNFWTSYEFLKKEKRLKAGAWNILIDDPKQKKFRTKDAEPLYNNDSEFKESFDKAIKECIQTEIIDKYDVV
jgi:recombination protein RecA